MADIDAGVDGLHVLSLRPAAAPALHRPGNPDAGGNIRDPPSRV